MGRAAIAHGRLDACRRLFACTPRLPQLPAGGGYPLDFAIKAAVAKYLDQAALQAASAHSQITPSQGSSI